MRPVKQTLGAAGFSPWVPLSYNQPNFNASCAVVLSSAGSATSTVQCTYDDIFATRNVSISRSGTTATVIDNAHGLSVGDAIIVQGSLAPFSGQYQVAGITDANTYTYTVANSGATADNGNSLLGSGRVFSVSGLSAVTSRTAGSILAPVIAVRLDVSTYVSGTVDLLVVQGLGSG